jgi:thiol-disulfide isomerase/thioredoxin
MSTASRRINMRRAVLILIAAVLSLTTLSSPIAKAQDTMSIVGSSPLPGLSGATAWINSPPLTAKQLKGRVVLVDFWDYSCINCIRAIP